jgi:hypothetical protein
VVRLFLPAQADAGAPIAFSWTARRVPKSGKLVIQRQVGTAHHWATAARLKKGTRGQGSLPPLAIGRYRVRIAVLVKKRRNHRRRTVVLARNRATLHVFGTVPFSKLFKRPGAPGHSYFEPGTYTTPSRTYDYVLAAFLDNGEQDKHLFTVRRHGCRSIHFDFLTGGKRPPTTTLTIVQAAADPTSASAPRGEFGALDARLTPGQSWALNVTDSGFGGRTYSLYMNGSASCDRDAPL